MGLASQGPLIDVDGMLLAAAGVGAGVAAGAAAGAAAGGVDAACTCVCRDILGTVRIKPMYGATIRLPFKLMAPLLLLQSMTPHDVAWRVPSKCCIDLS